ncbi:hypothetical protein B1J94_01950 [Leptospira kirschneri serovar Grippotyphosa]|nr:hypothetical protein B1J94_01950 [Leptospira kirschneri serovar Grippotyphosa]
MKPYLSTVSLLKMKTTGVDCLRLHLNFGSVRIECAKIIENLHIKVNLYPGTKFHIETNGFRKNKIF